MFNILDELREMISLLGGDPAEGRDIGYAVMVLKKLVVAAASRPNNNHRHFEDRRKERPAETEE